MKKKILLWSVCAAVGIICAVLLLSLLASRSRDKARAVSADTSYPVGSGAAFDAVPVTDFLLTSEEGEFWLSDLEGTPLVIHFFAPDGNVPGEELLLMNDLSLQYEDRLLFLPVCAAEDLSAARALFSQNGIALPLYAESSSNAKEACAVTQTPSTVFIDDGGFLAARSGGAVDEETMRFGISLIAPGEQDS